MNDFSAVPSPWVGFAPMRMQLLPSYHKCLASVCMEKKFLMMTKAPPIDSSREYVQSLLEANMPMVVAFVPGPTVVGWCDIYSPPFESQAHLGKLGIGVRSDYREQGLGSILLELALKQARMAPLERVELEVFANNTKAIKLYKKFRFEVEGVKKKARKIDGGYHDTIMMATHF